MVDRFDSAIPPVRMCWDFLRYGVSKIMVTIEAKVNKIVGLHERGLLTEAEVFNDLLLIFSDVSDSQYLAKLFNALPDRLRAAVRNRLNRLSESDFDWQPFMIGEGFSDSERERLCDQARSIHASLSGSE